MSWVFQRLFIAPTCVTIPGLRSPGRADVKPNDFSGADIIHRVTQLQNPQHHQQERKEDFRRIVRFLQRVTDSPSAELEIPYGRDTIIVHMDDRAMSLEALGTGIHEVIILAGRRYIPSPTRNLYRGARSSFASIASEEALTLPRRGN